MKSVPSAVADGLNAQLEVDREFILSPAKEQHEIRGLTTAASVWMTAAIGITVGLGSLGIAIMVNILALIILALEGLERRVEDKQGSNDRATTKQP